MACFTLSLFLLLLLSFFFLFLKILFLFLLSMHRRAFVREPVLEMEGAVLVLSLIVFPSPLFLEGSLFPLLSLRKKEPSLFLAKSGF